MLPVPVGVRNSPGRTPAYVVEFSTRVIYISKLCAVFAKGAIVKCRVTLEPKKLYNGIADPTTGLVETF